MILPRSTSRVLDVASIAMLGGVVWIGFWAVSPLPTDPATASSGVPAAAPVVAELTDRDQIDVAPALVTRSLRGPLVDPPKVVAPAKPPRKPKVSKPKPKPKPALPRLDLSLVGTMLSDSGDLAILSNPQGQFDVKGVGEVLDLAPAGMTLRTIDATAVTVEYQGEQITFEVDKSISESSPAARRRR